MTINKNIYVPILLVIISIICVEFFNTRKCKHPDVGLNIEQLVQKYGYPIEIHNVTTDDDYILTLHRIPHGRSKTIGKRTPVLFMHGFMQSGIDYVHLGPNRALSLLLADRGYDIWLGNARGTTWSRKHKNLDPDKDLKFWDYSLHEIGVYDGPALIDYILRITGESSLHYVGYSQGTSVFFILGSEKPEYVTKVKLMTALAPAIYLKNPLGPALGLFVYFRKFIQTFFYYLPDWEFLSSNGLISLYLKQICDENSLLVDICLHHTFLIHGYNRDEVNMTMLPLQFSNTPAGVSTKQTMHIGQWMESGEFQQYDLGVSGNLDKYGQREPPRYDLAKITTPVALYYSSNDWTVNIKNIERIVATLPNVVKQYQVPLDKFNHNDFINAKNVVNLLYDSVIEQILNYK